MRIPITLTSIKRIVSTPMSKSKAKTSSSSLTASRTTTRRVIIVHETSSTSAADEDIELEQIQQQLSPRTQHHNTGGGTSSTRATGRQQQQQKLVPDSQSPSRDSCYRRGSSCNSSGITAGVERQYPVEDVVVITTNTPDLPPELIVSDDILGEPQTESVILA